MSANQNKPMCLGGLGVRSAPTTELLSRAALSGLAFAATLAFASQNGAIAGPLPPAAGSVAALAQTPILRPVAVFGHDDRVPLPQSFAPLASKIGVIYDRRSQSVCTAFCVAPDAIATAAHCLYRTVDEPPLRLSDLTVRLSSSHLTSRIAGADGGAPEANVLSGSMQLKVRPPIEAAHDWALVRLARPLCQRGWLPLARRTVGSVMRLAGKDRVYNVAYHRDLPKWQPMLARPCRVRRSFKDADWTTIRHDFAAPDQLILHTCDTGGASSGSPLLVEGPDGPEVVGINVGTYVQSKVVMLNGEVVHRFRSDDVANTGVNSLAFAAALDRFRRADLLAGRRDIRRLQQRLAARGLYRGPRDGRFGPKLKAAIEDFERASEMPVTGLATRPLLEALAGESAVVTGKIPSEARDGAAGRRRLR